MVCHAVVALVTWSFTSVFVLTDLLLLQIVPITKLPAVPMMRISLISFDTQYFGSYTRNQNHLYMFSINMNKNERNGRSFRTD